ncbi:MAG TPA: hypothetical protein VFO66_05925 [Gemmatimonadaceae bacterium]|nr:hypothetical protein [Gemmatimonadaceae bacterium]
MTACARDVVPPGDIRLAPGVGTYSIADPDTAVWNTFEADVAVILSIVDGGSKKANAALSYKVRKRRDLQGRWITEQHFADWRPIANGRRPNVSSSRIARAEYGADGRSSSYYGPAGELLPQRLDPPALPERPGPPPSRLSKPDVPARMLDTSRAWIDRYIVTSAAARRERTRLAKHLGEPERSNGRSRFAANRGRLRAEFVVNDTTGVVEEERLSEEGRLVAVTSRRYVRTAEGTLLLAGETISRVSAYGERQTVVDVYFSNIRLIKER